MARAYREYSEDDLPHSLMQIHPIPGGDSGTRATLKKMKEIVHKSIRHPQHGPFIRNATLKIIVDYGCRPKDFACEYRSLHEFVRDRVRWTKDARRFETLTWPARTLAVGAGDCDDKSMLLASMLLLVGMPVAFKAIAANPQVPEQYTHVYVIAAPYGEKRGWVASDPTVENAKLGWESPLQFKKMILEL